MEQATQKITDAMENCQFNVATDEIRQFTWHSFCDNYIEAVKHRLYQPETYGEEKREAARYTLYNVIYRVIQLLSPISPHITEELYQIMYSDIKKHQSIHTTLWPITQKQLIDKEIEQSGDLIVAVMAEIRRDKAENQKPLNAPIRKLTIYSENQDILNLLCQAGENLVGTCKIEKIEFKLEIGKGRKIQGYSDITFVTEY
jgi:valyl-tRNA synthetase